MLGYIRPLYTNIFGLHWIYLGDMRYLGDNQYLGDTRLYWLYALLVYVCVIYIYYYLYIIIFTHTQHIIIYIYIYIILQALRLDAMLLRHRSDRCPFFFFVMLCITGSTP
jgi:hypothetical protein